MTLEAQRTSTPIDATTLAAIEDRVAMGDRGAFAELVDLLLPRVHRQLEAALGASEADALASSVLVEAWRTAPRIRRSGASIAAWALARTATLASAAGSAAA
ncbi:MULTISPECIES: hypothetical protein [unclassified Agrococcus]|uniref:hypothetical protein n=1 Tax=unclassified Agrococcus TaxID=2615065 RepID=UPI00360D9214